MISPFSFCLFFPLKKALGRGTSWLHGTPVDHKRPRQPIGRQHAQFNPAGPILTGKALKSRKQTFGAAHAPVCLLHKQGGQNGHRLPASIRYLKRKPQAKPRCVRPFPPPAVYDPPGRFWRRNCPLPHTGRSGCRHTGPRPESAGTATHPIVRRPLVGPPEHSIFFTRPSRFG